MLGSREARALAEKPAAAVGGGAKTTPATPAHTRARVPQHHLSLTTLLLGGK